MADVDPTMKGLQAYAKRQKEKAVDSHTDGAAPAPAEPAASAPGGMSQSAFTKGGKRQNTPQQNAQLAELLRKRAAGK